MTNINWPVAHSSRSLPRWMRWSIVTISLGHSINPNDINEGRHFQSFAKRFSAHLDILHLQNVSFPNCDEILVVNDASENVGSGGSALNALIRTAERLCYRKGFAVLTDTVLHDANVLIVLVVSREAPWFVSWRYWNLHMQIFVISINDESFRVTRKQLWTLGIRKLLKGDKVTYSTHIFCIRSKTLV